MHGVYKFGIQCTLQKFIKYRKLILKDYHKGVTLCNFFIIFFNQMVLEDFFKNSVHLLILLSQITDSFLRFWHVVSLICSGKCGDENVYNLKTKEINVQQFRWMQIHLIKIKLFLSLKLLIQPPKIA